jgi:hypothetical protein
MDSNKNFSNAVVTTVRSGDLGGLSKDYAEIALDSVLSEGLLRDLPIVKTLVAVGRIGLSINNQIFAKKLISFLCQLSELSPQVRAEMIDRLDKEEGFRQQVGDRLIEILDRVDSHAKPEMLAKAFRAYAAGQIDGDMLNRLNNAIEKLPHYEIKAVRLFHSATVEERRDIAGTTLGALTAAGLTNLASGWDALIYEPNAVCNAFVAIGLG